MTPSVRPYARSDEAACVGIFDRAWHAGHPYAPRIIDAANFRRETEDETLFVAVDAAGTVVGFVALYEPQSFIHHLYVEPALRSNGIGRALLAHAVAAAGGRASLKCQTRNAGAFAFYRRLGWIEIAAGQSEFGPWVALRSP